MKITKKWMLAAILAISGNSIFTTSCTTAEYDNYVVKEIDYLVLVNKTHQLPAYWENALKTVKTTNTVGEEVEAEYKAYAAYLKLKEAMAAEGVDIQLDSDYNEDLVQYPEVWAKIHAKLADYGFILRYLEGKEDITGYSYEPWHIRYIDDVALAKDITARGITLEEYLEEL